MVDINLDADAARAEHSGEWTFVKIVDTDDKKNTRHSTQHYPKIHYTLYFDNLLYYKL